MDRSRWWVAGQAAALAGIVLPVRARWRLGRVARLAACMAVTVGGAVALAGAVPHGRRLTPFVDPPDDAVLLTEGVYRFSRHPIYGGLLLGAAGMAVLRRHPVPMAAWLGLAGVLGAKTRLEECALTDRFGPAYSGYAARTPRYLGAPRRPRPVAVEVTVA